MPGKTEKPGPKPDRLVIDKLWEEAVGEALPKERPKDGWPKADEPKTKREEGPPTN